MYWLEVSTGIKATPVTNTARSKDCGTRFSWSRSRSSAFRGAPCSPVRATHSSRPICGPAASGFGSVGEVASPLTSNLLKDRGAEDAARPEEHEDDEDREDDQILEGGR